MRKDNINVFKACELARRYFIENNYTGEILRLKELNDKWVFTGMAVGVTETDYGNCSVAVEKSSGNTYEYNINAPNNVIAYIDGKLIDIPKKYKYKG